MFEFISFLSFGGLVSMMTFAKVMLVVFGLLTAFAAVVEIVDCVLEADASDENVEIILKSIEELEGTFDAAVDIEFARYMFDDQALAIETGAEELAIPMASKVLTPFWGITLGIEKSKNGSYPNPLVKSQWQQLGELLIA